MLRSVVYTRLASLLLLIVGTFVVWLVPELGSLSASLPNIHHGGLSVHFLDVGQGDAIYIVGPTGTELLIDGGPGSEVLGELMPLRSFFDRTLEYVLATHPDTDHVGGLVPVLEQLHVPAVIMTENEGDSRAAEAFTAAVAAEGAAVTYARRGQRVDLGGGAVVDILFPETNPSELESNTASIVAKLTYGSSTLMLTGDAPKSIEEYLTITHGEYLKSDLLKVGHHGSRTSTAEDFLAEVAPTYAVISAEKDSRYGHPHLEVTDALFNAGVITFSTAEVGTVSFWSDGHQWFPPGYAQ